MLCSKLTWPNRYLKFYISLLVTVITAIAFYIILMLFATCQAWSVMDIEIVRSHHNKTQITVTGFVGESMHPDAFGQLISEIIRADLKNSGRFLTKKRTTAEQELCVAGEVQTSGRDQDKLQVNYALTAGKNRSLASGHFRIAPNQIRKLAHHISAEVYRTLTGQPSIFETKLAYVLVTGRGKAKQYNIMVSDYDGFEVQNMLQSAAPIMSLSWSPDGRQLAYVSFEGNRSAIYLQQLTSGKREIVSKLPGINGAPAWSPDGRKLAIVLTTSGYPKIHQLDLASRKLTQLTFDWYLDTEPNWAPDGQSLVFTSDRSGAPQIHRLDLTSGRIERITYQGSYNARASFSGDGKRIVFLHRDSSARSFTVAIQNVGEGKLRVLATVGARGEAPAISPNGEMILFVHNQYNSSGGGGKSSILALSLDGERTMVLPGIAGEIRDPVWSPR